MAQLAPQPISSHVPALRPGATIRLPGYSSGNLTRSLSDLLGAESSDTVEAETEDDAVLLSDSHVEGVVLGRDGATVPTITQGDSGTDE